MSASVRQVNGIVLFKERRLRVLVMLSQELREKIYTTPGRFIGTNEQGIAADDPRQISKLRPEPAKTFRITS
ncbi:hypothetical protein [Methylobacterium gossipiicola]|uniref:hypothetical protein n=1 Tax=Methylobacterium gossipiicola TaxID=582675 RepID=UPI0015A5B725|nr:hypothetical protein [Methylobacterium gossipiicola]